MTVSTAFGPAVSATQLEQAALATLRYWLPTYLCWVEDLTGREPESLPAIRSWSTANEFAKRPEDQIPAVILIAPGTVGQPTKDGSGLLTVTWELNVGIVHAAKTAEAANGLVKDYATAVSQALLNHRSLGGVASGLDYIGEAYDDVPEAKLRGAAVAQVDFHVQVYGARSLYGGPALPGCDQSDLGQVQEVDIDGELAVAGGPYGPDIPLVRRSAP